MKVTSINTNLRDRVTRRNSAVLEDLDLVRAIARSLARRLPGCIDLDDLVSVGMLGLIQALERFDHTMDVELRTYARHRIRGAMLDFLRDQDPLSRRERAKLKASASELSATGPGASFVTYSLTSIPESVLNRLGPTAHSTVLIQSEVRQARRCLSGMENRVIELLYDLDLTRNEVAAMFGLNPTRISQIKHSALQKMRVWLEGDWAPKAA